MQYFTIKFETCNANGIEIPIECKYILKGNDEASLAYATCLIGKGEFIGMSCPETYNCPIKNIPKILPYPFE